MDKNRFRPNFRSVKKTQSVNNFPRNRKMEFVTKVNNLGKAGLTMLLHLVMKVGKLLQPTVIYIGNAEKTFVKKAAKNDMSDPKRLKKELPKIIKKMTAEDRILFVGTSLTPWDILLTLQLLFNYYLCYVF